MLKEKILNVENLSKNYGKKEILSNINFDLFKNECLGIMGESGSGKSSIAKLLVRLEKFEKGEIKFKNLSYKKLNKNDSKIINKKIQLVFQNSLGAVNPKFTVEKILLEPLNVYYKNLSYEDKKQKIIDLLEKVKLSEQYLNFLPNKLSGGQLQRVCIARALIIEPEIIIFDESFSGLDPIIEKEILNLLVELKEKINLTYIFISHNFKCCYFLCDRILIIDEGKVIETVENLKNFNIEKFRNKFF